MESQQIVLKVLNDAIQRHASDIYFLPHRDGYLINFNVDGLDIRYQKLKTTVALECINYLKFQAHMNISEHRRPQLGAWRYSSQRTVVDCRLSSVGDFQGSESLVVRLIYAIAQLTHQRYFVPDQWQVIKTACRRRGLVIFSGPTGSGKTTSMYKLAEQFGDQQILSIEDPIEIFYPDILQLQVNEKAGMAYQDLVKVALRHHPNILIIGEIRDQETAKIAIQAALSGHLVLSTVHAANCYGVVSRLCNLEISLTDLEQTLQLINYQRLIPTTSHETKVLFDQLDLRKNDPYEILEQRGMTPEWKQNLKEIYQRQEITHQDYERYLYG